MFQHVLTHAYKSRFYFSSQEEEKTFLLKALCAEGCIIGEYLEKEKLYINTLSLQLKERSEHRIWRQKKWRN